MSKEVPNEVIVVEGRDDTKRLIETFGNQIKTIETNGSAIDQAIIDRIRYAQKTFGVIVFTDPDYPGLKIRRTIRQAVPEVKEAFLLPEEANAHRKGASLGIEHARPEAIRRAIAKVAGQAVSMEVPLIATGKLMSWRLIGHPQATRIRDQVARRFNLGHVNGKQLQKQLARYRVSEKALASYLKEVGWID